MRYRVMPGLLALVVSSACSSSEPASAPAVDAEIPDTSVALDTGAPDTFVALDTDSGADTTVIDSAVDTADTTDTTPEPDTAPEPDTTPAPDTTVADTTVADTAVAPDTSMCLTPDAGVDAAIDAADAGPKVYTVSTSGETVLDSETGLTWQRAATSAPITWFAARDYCAALTLDGVGGFRIPRRDEIATIFDPTATSAPYINSTAFPSTLASAQYWTSTHFGQYVNYAWAIDFGSAASSPDPTFASFAGSTATLRVRCVRGGTSRYTVSTSGLTAYDRTTKLTWQLGTSPTALSVADGMAYCAALELDGGCWRLPKIDELGTLFEVGVSAPCIDKTVFPTSSGGMYWSSTVAGPTGYYAEIGGSCVRGTTAATVAQRIRCVR